MKVNAEKRVKRLFTWEKITIAISMLYEHVIQASQNTLSQQKVVSLIWLPQSEIENTKSAS
jgi:hypothetical protein